jgi:DNA (cytosine-5)-methyltransferase 1
VKPRLLDLFCGVGGCTKGYQRAGFYVVGVDNRPQPNYCGDEFVQADALEVLAMWSTMQHFAAIHASPPCQAYSAYRRKGHGVGDGYPDLIAATRRLLNALPLPHVIENVEGAPLRDPVTLCGSSFGLDVRRHRLFETSWPVMVPPCAHGTQRPRFPAATNRRPNSRRTVEVGVWRIPLEVQKQAMGVDWDVTLEGLSQAIPPAYTEHIGHQLMQHIALERAA